MKYRITLAYDGTDYSGFQFQAGLKTIQGVLNSAVDKLESAPVTLHAAGRTDAGFHAEGQVISFQLNGDLGVPSTLVRAINGNLPDDIRVLDAARAPEDFHARFNAKGKTYRYQVEWRGHEPIPAPPRLALWLRWPSTTRCSWSGRCAGRPRTTSAARPGAIGRGLLDPRRRVA